MMFGKTSLTNARRGNKIQLEHGGAPDIVNAEAD
jgi:hypothetical protein